MRMAARAHREQVRKESDLPYITHPFMVAFKLLKYNFPDKVIAAALVHDVLEDTDVSKDILREELGEEVLEIVISVTNDDTLSWDEKKIKYIEAVRSGGESAKAVATADKVHNLESLLVAHQEQGPDIWKNFNRGKEKKIWFEEEMLKMLKSTWKHPLVDEYEKLLTELKRIS